MSQTEILSNIAYNSHLGQFRRDGVTPYFDHLIAVTGRLAGEEDDVIATGWGHDLFEDTKTTAEYLRLKGIKECVIEAIEILTKRDEVDYFVYLERVRNNHIARKVKIADMLSNLSDKPTINQIRKYCIGLQFLLADE